MAIKASELKIGDQLAECDGFLFTVSEIVRHDAESITVRLNSDFSSFRSHWNGEPGIVKSFRKDVFLAGIAAAAPDAEYMYTCAACATTATVNQSDTEFDQSG